MSQPDAFGPDFGARLNVARQRQGISVVRLAELIDLSADNVRELLNGKRTPTPAVAERLARALDLDEDLTDQVLSVAGGRWTSSFGSGEVHLSG